MSAKKRFSPAAIILLIFVFAVLGAVVVPFLHIISVSVSNSAEVMKGSVGLFPKGFSLDVYKYVLEDNRIFTSYKNTIVYTVVGTSLSLITTAMGAYALSKKRIAFHKLFSMMILFTMFFSGGMIPTYLVVKSLGIIDTMWGVVLPGAISTWNFIVMRSFFQAFPLEIEESGCIDGLTDIGIFFKLVLPLSKAVLATIGLYYAVSIWNAYFTPFLYLNSYDKFPLQMILREILLSGSSNMDALAVGDSVVVETSLQYATVIVSTLPIVMIYPFLQKYFVKGVMVGSIKG